MCLTVTLEISRLPHVRKGIFVQIALQYDVMTNSLDNAQCQMFVSSFSTVAADRPFENK